MTDTLRPWLGLASFTEAHAAQFFGREAEVTELVRRLSRKGLTVLFGQSGLGKTSMLQAGVVPRLRDAGFAPVLLRLDYSAEAPSPGTQILTALGWPLNEGLWEQLHRRDREGPAPLLIFDQFEEVFTLGQADEIGRAQAQLFLAQLADLVENRVPASLEARLEEDDQLLDRYDLQRGDFRLLISLREDYLAHLEPLKGAMPSITQNRMRIAPMTGEQALQAVCGPGGELVSTDTAEAIVCFVSGARSLQHAQVEPALLSLILRELNEQRIAKGQAQITPDLLAGSHAAILSDFYERSLADQPAGVRHFIEDVLLTDTGYRENVAEERVEQAFAAAGARPDALALLVNRRLLRVEERLDRRRVELTHDTLCAVVQASRENRREREAREAADARQQAQAREQAERLAVARETARRSLRLALGAGVLSAFALLSGGYGWWSGQRAQQAEQRADAARNGAEQVMAYLADDFVSELAPIGQVELSERLARQVLSYYDTLPQALRSDESERNRTLAELVLGRSLRLQAKADEAAALVSKISERLSERARVRGQPEENPAWLALEGRMLDLRGTARAERGEGPAGAQDGARAVELLRRAAALPDASRSTKNALGQALWSHGYVLFRFTDDLESAARSLDASMQLFVGLGGGPGGSDPRATEGVLAAASILVDAQGLLGRMADLEQTGALGQDRLAWLIQRQPQAQFALLRGANLKYYMARAAWASSRPAMALSSNRDSVAFADRALALSPNDLLSRNAALFTRTGFAAYLQQTGEIDQALRVLDEAVMFIEPSALKHRLFLSNAQGTVFERMRLLLDMGELAASEVQLDRLAGLFRDAPPPRWQCWLLGSQVELELARSDMAKAQARLDGAVLEPDPCASALVGPLARSGLAHSHRALLARVVSKLEESLLSQPIRAYKTDTVDTRISLALAQSQLGEPVAAAKTAAALLAWLTAPEQVEAAGVDAGLRFQRAQVLAIQALVQPGEAGALRAQARRLIDGLPAQMRPLRSVQFWRGQLEPGSRIKP